MMEGAVYGSMSLIKISEKYTRPFSKNGRVTFQN